MIKSLALKIAEWILATEAFATDRELKTGEEMTGVVAEQNDVALQPKDQQTIPQQEGMTTYD